MNQIIMYLMAFGALIGGLDCAFGNRFGLGSKFESGFHMLGPVALAMAGIICLTPVLSSILEVLVVPMCRTLHMDPGIFGSILAIDMGGHPLSMELAEDPEIGRFSGIIASSIFGCTIVFTIPVGLGFLSSEQRPYFTRGILIGLAAMPAALVTGGLMMGLGLFTILWNSLPILLISGLLALGILLVPHRMMNGFLLFARMIRAVAVLGLTAAAVTHLSSVPLLPSMIPLQEAMETVSAIGIVALGSMPLAELLQHLLKVPFRWISEKTGLNSACTTGLLLGLVTATPALALIPEMNNRGKVVVSACFVSGICSIGAHLAYANACEPQLTATLIAVKLLGGTLGGVLAMIATRNLKETV